MSGDIFVKVTLSLFSFFWTIVSLCLIPYLRTKADKERLEQVHYFVEVAVKCAEQIFTPEERTKKKEYVMEIVRQKCFNLGIDITYDQLDTIVEGVVYTVKKGENGN